MISDKNELHDIHLRDFTLRVQHRIINPEWNTIVFLHDSLGCIALWRDFPEKMARAAQTNFMVYDRRGYGASGSFGPEPRQTDYMETEADILIELLDRCGMRNPILFGHSDGGTIALLAAAKYPEAIKAVLTEGAHVFVEDITLDGIAMAKEQYRTTSLQERLQKYHGGHTQALFEAWTETWLSEAFYSWNMEHFLPHIKCPVLVIQGVEDEYGSAAQVTAIVSASSGPAEACMVVNAGHSPHKQNELWLIDRCCIFLDQHGLLT